MNPTIVKMIDLMFRGLPENEETNAIREELLTNSQARYDDLIAAGESPNTALGQVMDNLRGMEEVLDEYRSGQKTDSYTGEGSGTGRDLFADLRRRVETMGSQWEKTAEEMKRKLESVAGQLENQWDAMANEAEDTATKVWDSAMEGFQNAMNSVHPSADFANDKPECSAPCDGEESDGMLIRTFTAEEARSIQVQLVGEDVQALPSRDGLLHVAIPQEDAHLFLVENNNGAVSLRLNPCADDANEEWNGLGGLIRGIGKAFGSVLRFGRTSGGAIHLRLPSCLETVALQTTSGDIEMLELNQKNISLSTTSGDIDITGCTADTVRIHTTSGDVEAAGCTFTDVQLHTVSGDVDMDGQLSVMKANSVSGDLDFCTTETLSSLHANSTSGDITVCVPASVVPAVSLQTVSGDTQVLCQTDPASAVIIRLCSVSGDLSVEDI